MLWQVVIQNDGEKTVLETLSAEGLGIVRVVSATSMTTSFLSPKVNLSHSFPCLSFYKCITLQSLYQYIPDGTHSILMGSH
jgi:hypothetical protein